MVIHFYLHSIKSALSCCICGLSCTKKRSLTFVHRSFATSMCNIVWVQWCSLSMTPTETYWFTSLQDLEIFLQVFQLFHLQTQTSSLLSTQFSEIEPTHHNSSHSVEHVRMLLVLFVCRYIIRWDSLRPLFW